MSPTFVAPNYAVSGQISVDDIALIKQQGFVVVVNNRPDGEASDQPSSAQIAKACHACGLVYRYLPMSGPLYTAQDVKRLQQLIQATNGSILAFCRSGRRSRILWSAAST